MENPTDLRLGLMIRIFAGLAVAVVVALAVAPVKGVFTEWRDEQGRYNEIAAARGIAPVDTGIRQIWNPDLGIVDRCTSCHLGMAGGEPLSGEAPFGAHPPIPHDPEQIGCTPCHGGQGRATKKEAAHGDVAHWFTPLLPLEHIEAGCGSCHSAIPTGSATESERGRKLLASYDCLACHRMNGRGGGRAAPEVMPDLSGIGMKGVPEGWYAGHLERRAADPDGLAGEAIGPIPPRDLAAIESWLRTLSGAPRLTEGKRLFHALGCRGCHQVNGVGGTEGADLTGLGSRPVGKYLFPKSFPGEKTAFSWQVEHLLAPAEVVEDSRMPDQDLTRADAEKIALYLLSLRRRELPPAFTPPDRARADRLGEREFGTDGENLHLVFCAACHGAAGDGRPYGEMKESFPAIASPDVLAVASDEWLGITIAEGRPGRRMAAWSGTEGGLRDEEVRRLVRWLRSREPEPPGLAAVVAASLDPELGRRTWADDCAVCHGGSGEGGIGPSLSAPAFGSLATEAFVHRVVTEGRTGTAMARYRVYDAGTLKSLIAHVRGFANLPVSPATPGADGDAAAGGKVYAASCAACHGRLGEGGIGPGIGKRGFWQTAGPAFLAASYTRGRCRDEAGKTPPAVPRPALFDAAVWLARGSGRPEVARAGRTAPGDPEKGRRLYLRSCAGCHGKSGEGKEAPALANPGFLATTNDGYLEATIVRGRSGTAMPSFNRDHPNYSRLAGAEIDDIVTFIRSLGGKEGN